jgi:hypothetical protein
VKRWLLLALAIGFTGNRAGAAELAPYIKNQHLGLNISSIGLPENLPKDLVSGLTNTLLIRAILIAGPRELVQATASITAKYDLWEETFSVTLTINDTLIEKRTARSVQEVLSYLGEIRLPGLFSACAIPKDGSARIKVEMLLNPIDRQRLEAIKKWVADNSTYTPADTSSYSDKRVASSRSNALFNRIFEQYAQGADVAAAWKESAFSKPLKLEEVRVER